MSFPSLSLAFYLVLVFFLLALFHLFVVAVAVLLIPGVVVEEVLPEPRHRVGGLRRGELGEPSQEDGDHGGLQELADRREGRLDFFFFEREQRRRRRLKKERERSSVLRINAKCIRLVSGSRSDPHRASMARILCLHHIEPSK